MCGCCNAKNRFRLNQYTYFINIMIKKLRLKNVVALIGFHLFLLISFSVFAQNKTITGTVTDASNGQTLPGVTIRVKNNTNKISTTDLNGKYSISADAGSALIFSYIGFADQEILVGTKTVISPKLGVNTKSLSEVVVIGYGTAKRSDLTGSVSSVNAATIAKVPVVTVDQALQGRAAGVQVTNNDASPGGNISVLIRGTGSLAPGGNGPLYVIDGYPVETGGINNINPSDIASIDVLKDASSAAIYGIRAANGVVIVTTKKGRKDGVQISLDAYNAFQSRPKTYKLLDAQQFATLANQTAANDVTKQFVSFPAWSNPASLTNADWQKAIYRSGLTQNYSLALRGGSDKVQAATSVGYYNQKGIVLGSYFKRITLGLNLDYQPVKWLKSSTSAKYTYQNLNNPFGTSVSSSGLGVIAQLPPTLNGGSNITSQIMDSNGNYGFYNPIYTYTAKYGNPIYSINTNQYANVNQYLLTNSSLEATVFTGLKIKTNAGITITNGNGTYFSPSDGRIVAQYGAAGGASQNAAYSQSQSTSFDWLWENTIAYDRTFGKHAISFVGGISQQQITNNGFSGSGVPPNNVIRDLSQVNTGTLVLNTTAQVIQSLASVFARLNYTFDEKYILTATVRRDGSSKFAQGHQYGTFPSGALAWKVKQESFLKDAEWLNDFKLRGSYGISGNQATIQPFQYEALYQAGTAATTSGNYGYPFNKTFQSGIVAIQPANPNLKWETDYQTDIGTDISFLKGDLTFAIDYFNRRSKDFLLNIPVPPQTGFLYETKNVGSMTNKGFEFAANYNHTIKDFKFGVGITASILRNTLTSLTAGTNSITNPITTPGTNGQIALPGSGWSVFSQTYVGQAVGEFYGYKSLGIIQTQAQLDALNAAAKAKGFANYQQAGTAPGDRLYADVNGDGHITADDQTSLGSPQPKFFGGLNLDGSYKAFDFNLFFFGNFGNKILNYQESNLETFQNRSFSGIQNIGQDYYANAWTPTNPSTKYARILYNDNAIGNSLPSSAWIENGSFVKLKNFTVGYTFPTALARKLAISRLRLYASTQNLFTITKYRGLDPEIGSQGGYATQTGVDNGTYPSSKFYTVGLNVTFQ
ncbi:MAG: TonB-dependent receptor [Sphingobacteriaceae bacterium]|nr:MAG: TonB-dependent receptor [Sphingobacteriaceae bacterium]